MFRNLDAVEGNYARDWRVLRAVIGTENGRREGGVEE